MAPVAVLLQASVCGCGLLLESRKSQDLQTSQSISNSWQMGLSMAQHGSAWLRKPGSSGQHLPMAPSSGNAQRVALCTVIPQLSSVDSTVCAPAHPSGRSPNVVLETTSRSSDFRNSDIAFHSVTVIARPEPFERSIIWSQFGKLPRGALNELPSR